MTRAAALGALALAACPHFDETYDRCVLEGNCRDVSVLAVTLAPARASLQVAVHGRVTQRFTLHSDAATVTPPLLVSVEGDGFTLSSDPCSGAPLAPLSSCEVELAFAPDAAGHHSGTLRVGTSRERLLAAAVEGEALDGWPLHISLAGTGAGTVSAPLAVCPPSCEQVLARDGGAVSLTAEAAAGSRFSGWSGDCSGAGTCTLMPGGPRAVTAAFDVAPSGATLTLSSSGPGRLSVSPGGAPCGPHCVRFATGTAVTLTAQPLKNQAFGGWAGDCTGTSLSCALTLDADRAAQASFDGPNVIFTTSTTALPGLLGGLDGGDARCEAHAADAGFHGRFFAWLSAPGTDAVSRLGNARGWLQPDGLPFADRLPSLRIYYPLELDERGEGLAGTATVATGTTTDGTLATEHCGGWSSTSGVFRGGSAGGGTVEWTDDRLSDALLPVVRGCGMPARLYCLTADRAVPVAPPPIPPGGRRFFVAWLAISGNVQGLARADAICDDLAADAGLPGSYVAWLKPNGGGPGSRVAADGGDWFRPDGVRIATAALLLQPQPRLFAAPNVLAGSQYASDRLYAWVGGTGLDGGVQNCGEWTSTSAGSAPQVDYLRTDAFTRITLNAACNTTRPYFCAQL